MPTQTTSLEILRRRALSKAKEKETAKNYNFEALCSERVHI